MSSTFSAAMAGTCLYPLTDRSISQLSHADQVARFAGEGVRIVQLREKQLSPAEFLTQATAALQVARELGMKIIINDRVDMALAVGADGVHLGQDDLPPKAAREILGPDAIIGFSTHNVAQAQLALKLPVDYIAIGPIFATATKTDSEKPLGLVELSRVRDVVGGIPLVAIGGITLENSRDVLNAGASSVALISDLWPALPSLVERAPHLF